MTRAADHTLDRVGRCERLTETIGEACLPIVLAPVPPDEASRGIEGWILRREDGTAERIVVYSGSDVFRCASDPDRLDYQCLLKLASIIVHEAWHYRHGPREVDDRLLSRMISSHRRVERVTRRASAGPASCRSSPDVTEQRLREMRGVGGVNLHSVPREIATWPSVAEARAVSTSIMTRPAVCP
jgi:hypothetical protein